MNKYNITMLSILCIIMLAISGNATVNINQIDVPIMDSYSYVKWFLEQEGNEEYNAVITSDTSTFRSQNNLVWVYKFLDDSKQSIGLIGLINDGNNKFTVQFKIDNWSQTSGIYFHFIDKNNVIPQNYKWLKDNRNDILEIPHKDKRMRIGYWKHN